MEEKVLGGEAGGGRIEGRGRKGVEIERKRRWERRQWRKRIKSTTRN